MNSLHVVLVYPEIPWNTGNAGRSCLAAGAALHLIEPLGFSLEDRYLQRAGLDYWPRVGARTWPNWERFEERLGDFGEPFFFTPEGGRDFWEVRYPAASVLVFGREGAGLPPQLRERHAERTVRIPSAAPGVRSLNLSTTVGIALYEVLRQRRGG